MDKSCNGVRIRKEPVIIASIVSIILLVTGGMIANRYVTGVYQPTMSSLQGTLVIVEAQNQVAAQTQFAAETASYSFSKTQEAESYAVQTQEKLASQTADAQQTLIAFENTQAAQPTVAPPLLSCVAVVNKDSLLFSAPGGYFGGEPISELSSVTIQGKVTDSDWVRVQVNGQPEVKFMELKALTIKTGSCTLETNFGLGYLAGWEDASWRAQVDETFASALRWSLQSSDTQIVAKKYGNEWVLPVQAYGQDVEFSTPKLRDNNLPVFKLFTYFTLKDRVKDSYISVRFADGLGTISEFRFYPYPDQCKFTINQGPGEYSADLGPKVCFDNRFELSIFVDTNRSQISVTVNGVPNKNIDIPNPSGNGPAGISLSVNNLAVDFNYIVVTVPR